MCVVAACLMASTALGLHDQTHEGDPLAHAAKVVVVGIPHLGLNDLAGGRVPAIEALAERGGLAALNVRTLSRVPSAPEAYATLGAGARVAVTEDAMKQGATDGAPASEGSSTPDVAARLVPQAPRLIADARARHLSSVPGALGTALGAAHLRTGVVSAAGDSALFSSAPRPPPAALAVMNASGDVSSATVVAGAEVGETSAVGATSRQFVAATLEMLSRAAVVVVDQTGPDRGTFPDPWAAVAAARAREAEVQRNDDVVGQLASKLPPDVLVVVVGIEPPTDTWELTPVIVAGAGVAHGGILSPTTKRVGLVTLEDIAPTILGALGLPEVPGMTGRPFKVSEHSTGVNPLVILNRDALYRERVYGPAALAYIAIQGSLYLAAAVALRPGRRRGRMSVPVRRFLRTGALFVAAVPLASYLWRAVPGIPTLGWSGLGVLAVLAGAAAAVAGVDHRHPLNPLRWILAATIGLLLMDMATGAHLQPASLLGYSLHTSSRFYGLGNTALAVLMTASVLIAGLYLGEAPDRQRALSQVAGFFVVVVFIAASPLLGAKVGAVLTLIPVFGAGLWRFSGRRLSPAAVVKLAMAVGTGLVSLGALDALRPADQRTHLGRLVSAIEHGRFSTFSLVVERKLGTTLRLVSTNMWSALLAVSAAVALYLLVGRERGAGLLALDTPLRTAAMAAVSGGLLGVVVNDSGSVMVAMVIVYLGPLLVLLACARAAETEGRSFVSLQL